MHPRDKSASYKRIVDPPKNLLRESFKLLRDLRAKQVDRAKGHGHQVNPSKLGDPSLIGDPSHGRLASHVGHVGSLQWYVTYVMYFKF